MKKTIGEIDTTIDEGKLLIIVLAHITTTTRACSTPDEVIEELAINATKIFYSKGVNKNDC